MNLHLPLGQLQAHALGCLGASARLTGIHLEPLEGGYVSAGVFRTQLQFLLPDGTNRSLDYVQKYTNPAEVRLMNALQLAVTGSALPQVIASDETADPAWFVTPWYPGPALTWDDDLPPAILRLLARVHTRFEGRGEEFVGVPRVDEVYFRYMVDRAAAALDAALFARERAILDGIRSNQRQYALLASLPLTLVHGDVHPGNVLKNGSDFVIIDWGTARIAPAMLDIANMVEIGSEAWDAYLSAWEEAGARKADLRLAELSYHWATIMISVQYLPWAVEHLTKDDVCSMMQRAAAAEEKINEGASHAIRSI